MHRSSRLVLLAASALAAACTWNSLVPRGRPIELPETAPSGLRILTLCQPVAGELDCQDRARECNHWYRLDISEPGELRVRLRFGKAQGQGELARLLVRPMGQALLGQQVTTEDEPLAITASVEPDVYGVLVQGAGAKRSYELWAANVAPGTPENESCPKSESDTPPDA